MSDSRTLNEKLVGNITFPLINTVYNRKHILRTYRFHRRMDESDPREIRQYQKDRLKKQLLYASEKIPYYKKLFSRLDLDLNNFHFPDDLKKIPPLTRQDLIENRLELIDSRYRKEAEETDELNRAAGAPRLKYLLGSPPIVRNTSSGSTGAPTVFYENGSVTAQNWSNELRVCRWFGFHPGTRQARFVRFTTDFSYDSPVNTMRRRFWNQLIVPGVNLKESDYGQILERLSRYNPRIYWGFTTAITGLAEFIEKNEIRDYHKPELIVTWAAPLYDFEKKLLEQVFGCPVTNIYGMREAGHLGCRCKEGKLHTFQDSVYVEEEEGELLVTPLYNTIMPLLRFRTGDLGKPEDSPCQCGKTLNSITDFTGRTGEAFYTKEGRMISPNFWCRTFMDNERSRAVSRFQVLYRRDKSIEIKLVKTPLYTEAAENRFRHYLSENFGDSTAITFREVDEIKPTVSGKYQMVVKE